MSSKTPTGSFYAIRKGRGGLEKCIFLHYKDAQPFLENGSVEDDESIEYHVFDALEEAAAYLQTTTEPLDAEMLASIATVVDIGAPPAAKKQRTSYSSTDGGQHRKPTKKWAECYMLLKESKQDGFKDQDMEKMTKWMKDQRYQYRLFQQGKPSSMTAEKIQLLRELDFKLPQIECTAPLVKAEHGNTKEKRGIYKKWYEQRDALKLYMDTHDGSWEIAKDNEEHAKLRTWIDSQQSEYKKFANGQESSMSTEKLQLLKEIGFEFTFIPFDTRFEQLRAFKQEHGHVDVPSDHAELGRWMQSIRRQCKSFAETADSTRDIDAKRFAALTALGVDPNRKVAKNAEEEAEKWDAMFAKLQQYKAQNGNTSVPRTTETKELYNWLVLQRMEYKKLQQGKPSKLTAPRLIKFNQIGFEFAKRGAYKNWDQRFEELKEYKAIHGHVNIPATDPDMGEFVSRQRVNYNKLRNGEKTPLTDERVAKLQEIGFNFEVSAPRRARTTPNKTWDERFVELTAFKNEFGHAVVPQHSHYTPGLGAWVKDQRKNYKAMLKGKKSSMSAEKALKLSSIGFVWDVFDSTKRRKHGEMEEMHVN